MENYLYQMNLYLNIFEDFFKILAHNRAFNIMVSCEEVTNVRAPKCITNIFWNFVCWPLTVWEKFRNYYPLVTASYYFFFKLLQHIYFFTHFLVITKLLVVSCKIQIIQQIFCVCWLQHFDGHTFLVPCCNGHKFHLNSTTAVRCTFLSELTIPYIF